MVEHKAPTTEGAGAVNRRFKEGIGELEVAAQEFPGFTRTLMVQLETPGVDNMAFLDRDGIRGALTRAPYKLGDKLTREGEQLVDKVVIKNYAGMTANSAAATTEEYETGRDFPPPDPGSAPTSGPRPSSPPSGTTAQQPAAAAPFARPGSGGAATGTLPAQLARPAGAPGGIDFTTLELRYLADSGSPDDPALRYAFTAQPAATGEEHRESGLQAAGQASDAFFVWLSLNPSAFWVNLNPDEPDRIVDAQLGTTEVGRIMLEADLRLKQDMAALQRPDNPLGAEYWRRRDTAGFLDQCFATRLWIVPEPATVSEDGDGLHILDAPLRVQLEKSDIRTRGQACSGPPADDGTQLRHEELLRQTLLPALDRAVDEGEAYADLRRIYLSRVAAQWYRERAAERPTSFGDVIDSGDVAAWTSRAAWSPKEVFDRYRTSFVEGDYTVPLRTSRGNSTFTAGGIELGTVPLVTVGADELRAAWPARTGTVQDAFDRPTPDQAGTVWLGGTTERSGFAWPSPFVLLLLGVAATVFVLWVRYRWRRRRRMRPATAARARRPDTTPRAQVVSDRLDQLRRDARRG